MDLELSLVLLLGPRAHEGWVGGGLKRGGLPNLELSVLLVLFRIFLIDLSWLVPLLFLGLPRQRYSRKLAHNQDVSLQEGKPRFTFGVRKWGFVFVSSDKKAPTAEMVQKARQRRFPGREARHPFNRHLLHLHLSSSR